MATNSTVDAITLFVEDTQRSKEFYGRVFGRTPIYEDESSVAFRLENLVLNILCLPAAHELIEPRPAALATDGSNFQLTVGVDDVDGACAQLREQGIELLNGPVDRPWGIRTVAFADPDGHVWELAREIEAPA
jgi:catechol 2,3-dioxygenase-like lactoylglutathione lyase family enzyme